MTTASFDPGSFRDRHGRVFYRGGEVYRAISSEALQEWELLTATRFFPRMLEEGKIVATRRSEIPPPEGDWAAVLHHDRIPFISYPYEWTFRMLKDAALLQLELLLSALQEGFILKDSSAFNFQWRGARPVLIDVLSFKKLQPGEVWTGYRQFCQMFLNPLMLQSYKNVPFHAWLRGNIDGISPADMNRIMTVRDLLRPGVFSHIFLQSKLLERMGASARNVKQELQEGGFRQEMVLNNVRGLDKLIHRLEWTPERSQWSAYTATTSYSEEEAIIKESFVREVIDGARWNLVWDLGCNTGKFSRMAAERARYVVAMDEDPLVVDKLYRSLKNEGVQNIHPLVMSLSDVSPALGWREQERKALSARGKPDLILCLALIHHMVITANIPVRDFVDWLADLGPSLVIEFVTREDPMVQKLLLNKVDQYHDYHVETFEQSLSGRFSHVRRKPLPSGKRILYYAHA